MQTPSHVAASLLIWRNEPRWPSMVAVVFGAILPDFTMFIFYGYQKFMGQPEQDIWSTLYFLDQWQWFFDIFNSIPIFFLIAVIAFWQKQHLLYLVSASALIHVLLDFPLHNDDAHRHFLPLTQWRFESPISYWDPKHFGVYAMIAELVFSVAACGVVGFGRSTLAMKWAARINLSLYGLVGILILVLLFLYSPT